MLTCEQMGEAVGISGITIHNYETGTFHPSLELLKKLALEFGIEPDKLYDDYYRFLDFPYSEKIKQIRNSLSLGQREFAKLLGTGQSVIGSWERKESVPLRKSWERLCKKKLL